MTSREVLDEIMRDDVLYKKSGGGVTLSGGEPAAQPAFAVSILRGAKERGLHTAIETCGAVGWNVLEEIMEVTDVVIYDLKHMDSEAHERLTGVGNERILANFERLAALGCRILVRVPLIPGCNDDDENLRATAGMVRRLGIEEIEIIPYHDFASGKYELLGLQYQLSNVKPYTANQLDLKKQVFLDNGVNARIGV
jgi:pyruvate formate lyase activating enzyme